MSNLLSLMTIMYPGLASSVVSKTLMSCTVLGVLSGVVSPIWVSAVPFVPSIFSFFSWIVFTFFV